MLRVMQGFDICGTWAELVAEGVAYGNHAIVAAGKFGGQNMRTNEAQTGGFVNLGGSDRIMFAGWYRITNGSTVDTTPRQNIIAYSTATGQNASIFGHNGSGYPRLRTQWQGASYVDGTLFNIQDGQYHWLCGDCYYNAAGHIKLYVDGFLDINYSGNTIASGTPVIDYTYFVGEYRGQDWDDLVIWDNVSSGLTGDLMAADFPMLPQRISPLVPTSDVTNDFARNTGSSNWSAVDEQTMNSDTDYVESDGTSGDRELYGMSDLPFTPTTIKAVRMKWTAKNAGGGTPYLKGLVKSGATESLGTSNPVGYGYIPKSRVLFTDPDTSTAWTGAAVDAVQMGFENT